MKRKWRDDIYFPCVKKERETIMTADARCVQAETKYLSELIPSGKQQVTTALARLGDILHSVAQAQRNDTRRTSKREFGG